MGRLVRKVGRGGIVFAVGYRMGADGGEEVWGGGRSSAEARAGVPASTPLCQEGRQVTLLRLRRPREPQ